MVTPSSNLVIRTIVAVSLAAGAPNSTRCTVASGPLCPLCAAATPVDPASTPTEAAATPAPASTTTEAAATPAACRRHQPRAAVGTSSGGATTTAAPHAGCAVTAVSSS